MKDFKSIAFKAVLFQCVLLSIFGLSAQDNALLFDGTNDHVTVTPGPGMDASGTRTFEAWVNPSTVTGINTIASWTDGGSNQIYFSITNGFLDVFMDDGGNSGSLTGTMAISANEWTHVAFIETAGSFEFLVNGALEFRGFNVSAPGFSDMMTLGIHNNTENPFSGLMDEVRMWDTNLDQTTIQNQMFTALTGSESNLIAYYQFNETTGTTLPDISTDPGVYNGTLVNFPGPTDPNWVASTALTETFTVINTNDSFSGSLREAITNANASLADNVIIDFNIPGGGPWNIALSSDLPNVTRSMTIDGTSQPGWNFSTENMVTLDLSGVTNGDGFNILSANTVIQGMRILNASFGIIINGELFDNQLIQDNIINQNITNAISIINADNVTIQGNHIGVSGDGTTNQATSGGGIAATSSDNIVIGGDRTNGDGNHIAGSAFSSYLINVSGTTNMATLEGNLVGASIGGADITTSRGVYIDMVDNVFVGNADNNRRNYIAGIDDNGALHIRNGDQVNVTNNYIGIGLSDSHAIGNASGNPIPGIELFNVTNFTIDGNVSSGNRRNGITLSANTSGGSITNNLIGVRPDGTTAFGNTEDGIAIAGSTVTGVTIGGAGNENIIAYNQDNGIATGTTSFGTVDIQENSIFCNTLLGIDITGTPVVAAPVITSVSTTQISGTTTAEDNANILIFQSVDGCNDDQGHTFLAEGVDVVSGGMWTVSGSFSLNNTYTAVVIDDEIAVDAVFGVSEFSAPLTSEAFTVTSVGDAGAGSLRQAVINANASTADQVSITFGILIGGGPWTINLASALPSITRSMIIDAATQPTWDMNTGQMVEIDGTLAGNVSAFNVQAANVEIYGFHIVNMQGNNGSTGVGVYISGETYDNFVIGGPGRGNVIGGGRFGISITNADNGIIQGNRIGTDMAGTSADGNTFHGIIMSGSFGTLIGGDSGAGEGNLISANSTASTNYGIEAQTSDNLNIYGNLIGTDRNGNAGLGNLNGGIHIAVGSDGVNIGSPTPGHANTISDNGNSGRAGILIAGGTSVVVDSNIIGLNSAGTASLGNAGNGIELNTISGAGMIIRNNTISANGTNGIELDNISTAALIEDNFIGTNSSGVVGSGHGNLFHGIAFRNSNGVDAANRITVQRNTISGNGDNVTDNGINFSLTNSDILIVDNFIGVESDGSTPLANLGEGIEINTSTTNVEIGGSGVENIISNNAGSGILFFGGSNSNGNGILENVLACNTDGAISFGSAPDVDAPVITSFSSTGISGTSTAPEFSIVRLFESTDGCNNNGAVTLINQTTVQSDGTWSFSLALNDALAHSVYVTDFSNNNVSEFSAVELFDVTSTADAGAGSLRQAILDANGSVNKVLIDFNLPSANDIINLTSGLLPVLDGNITIDATMQTGWNFSTGMIPTVRNNCSCADGFETGGGTIEIYGLRIADFGANGINSPILTGNLIVGAAGKGNVIVNNGVDGINRYTATGFIAQGNYLGLEFDGSAAGNTGRGLEIQGAGSGAIIGGSGAGEGNIIGSNGSHGIFFNNSDNNQIIGNYVGTDPLGTTARPNGQDGLFTGTLSDGHIIRNNIFSGNTGEGIYLQGGDNLIIQSNKIGVDVNGDPMGNGNNGIYFFGTATNNRIGGLVADANDIGSNGGYGILQDNASTNTNFYSVNSIHDNTSGGISHAAGVNSGIVPPVITSASTTDVSGTGVTGERVHVYLSDGNGQGETLLDSADVVGGNWTITGLSILLTDELVATATDLTNGSSEFSTPFLEQETFTVTSTANSGAGSLREAITNANASIANNVNIDFALSGDGSGTTWTIQPTTTFPTIARSTIIDGATQTGWNINTDRLVVLDGNLLGGGDGLDASSVGVEIYGLKITGFPVNGIEFFGSGSGGAIGDENRGNVINDNGNFGIRISNNSNVIIRGNRIGTDYSGTSAMANAIGINLNSGDGATIGGSAAGQGNLISGNFIGGVSGGSGSHHFEGNIIGLNISHNAAIPNATGISMTPSNGNTIVDNIISGNTGAGIELGGSNQIIINNTIGTDLAGNTDFGNSGAGIRTLSGDYDNWQIGTGNPGEGNVIAFNSGNAIQLSSSTQTGHLFSENSIYNNGNGISIGIANNGITAPNVTNVTSTTVSVDGVANGDRVEVFKGDGNGQGRTFIGTAVASGSTVTVGGLSQTIDLADEIVTTRTDGSNNTSNFSAAFFNYPSLPGSGSALSFNGTSDNVANTSPAGLPVGNAQRTVELWFKATKDLLTDTNTGLIQWGTTLTGQMFGLITTSNDPGKLYFFGNFADLAGTTNLVQDQWYHAAVKYDGANVTLYLNGVEEATAAIPLNTVIDANGLNIGFRPGVAFWQGEIDEVRIWDISLSQATIRDWATRKLDNTHANYGNLVSYYRFDEGSGTVLADLVGDNDATISGAMYETSGAHLGDETAYVLGNSSVALGPPAASGNNLTVNNIQGNPDITYLYRIDEAPNDLTLAPGLNSLNATDYYGVFQTGGTNPTFNAQWFYTNNTGVNGQPDENGIRFVKRANNEDGAFDEISSSFLDISTSTNIVIDRNLTSGEFAQGVTDAYPEPAPPGNALTFDGTDDQIITPSTSFTAYTIEAWVKFEGSVVDRSVIKYTLSGNPTFETSHQIRTDASGHFVHYTFDGAEKAVVGTTVASLNTWYHVAIVAENSGQARLYVNGVEEGSSVAIGTLWALGDEIRLGLSGPAIAELGAAASFAGELDEVRVWNTALDQPTILSHTTQMVDNSHPNYDNLQAYYRFDESDGSTSINTLRDLAGTNDGTLTNFPADNSGNWGASGALDPLIFDNNALDFDGTSDAVFLPATIELLAQPASTIEAWFRIDGDPSDFHTIYSEENSGGATFYILRTVGNVVQYGVLDGSTWSFSTGSTQLEAGRWYHVAATYQDGVGTKLYLDGCLEDENPEDGRNPLGGAGGRKLGHQGVVNYFFDGALDEVRLWSIAKNETQIRNEILTELVGNEPGLLAYYSFNQGVPMVNNSGETTLLDLTSNGFDGTLSTFTLDGNNSNWVFSGALDPTPNEPRDLIATEISDTRIDLSWTDKSFNETDFFIERSDGNNTTWVQIGMVEDDVDSYSDDSVTPGNGYFYRVRATNGTENSGYTNEKFGSTITAPGNAIDLDGTDDFFSVPDAPELDITGDITISAWINPDSFDAGRHGIVGKFGNDPEESYYFGVQNDQLITNLSADGSTDDIDASNVGALTAGVWQHVAFTYNATSTTINYYVNGVNVGTGDHTGGINASTADLIVGWQSNFANAAFNGRIDEVRIWNIERTQSEIQADMGFPLAGNETGLIAYYRFDQGIAGGDNTTPPIDALPDRSTNHNHGTLQNATLNTGSSNWVASGADVDAPDAPSDLFTAEVSTAQIDLFWTDNSTKETGFTIERSVGNNSSWSILNSVAADVTTYSDISVIPGNGYHYRVIANGSLDSTPSNEKFASTLAPPGNGLDFDGVDDYVDLGNPPELRIVGDMTIEAWVYWEGANATTNTIISRSFNTGENADQDIFYRFGIGSTGNVVDFFEVNGTDYGVSSVRSIEAGVWTHVAMVRDATNLTEEFYINGDFAGRSSLSETPADGTHPGQEVWIGNRFGASIFFDGIIDELRIWDVARTSVEIQADFSSAVSLSGNETGLVGYYRFDQTGNFDGLPDRSINNNDGVLTNFPADPSPNWVGSHAMLGAGLQPDNLFAEEINASQIDLTWNDPTLAEDGFLIERSDGNNASYTQIGSVGPNVLSYSDNTVTADQGYFYRVIATSPSINSIPSQEKFGSTLTSPGNALEFDGIDDNLIVYNPDDLGGAPGQSFTWEAWLRVPLDISGGSGTGRFFLSRVETGMDYPRTDMSINKTTGIIGTTIQSAGGATSQPVVGVTDLRDFQWHHVAWVRDAVADEIRLYVDGSLEASATDDDVDGSNNGDLYIGDWGRVPQNGRNFFENMDEVRFWNVARTQAEIRSTLATPLVGNESGLVAYYKFDQDEMTDLILPDRSTNFNDGLWNGPVAGVTTPIWVASGSLDASVLLNNAMDFDGTDDFVSVPDDPSLQFGTGDVTIEAWFYFDGNPKNAGIVSKHNSGTPFEQLTISITDGIFNGLPGSKVFIEALPDGRSFVGLDPGPNDRFVASIDDLTVGWHHVALVQDYDIGLTLYLNGINQGTSTTDHGGLTFNITGQPLTIGSFNGSGFFDGQVDEVRVWNVTRSEAEIRGSIHTPLGGGEAGLVAYYSFDQGIPGGTNSGLTNLLDGTGNGNTGTLTNMGLAGATSNWITSGAQDGLPNEPTNLFATEVSDTQIDLTWTDNSFDETDFFIERSDGNNSSWVQIGMVEDDVTFFPDNTVTAGNGYFYRVRASNGNGNSGYTNEKFGSTLEPPGNALEFDGVDDGVNLGDQLPIDNVTYLTIESWIKVADFNIRRPIFSEYASSFLRNEMVVQTDGTISVHLGSFNGFTLSPISTGVWTHVAFVFDGTLTGTDRLKIYVDGIESPANYVNPAPAVTSATGLDAFIGSISFLSEFFEGEMDELRIWTKALNQTEISTNYGLQMTGLEPGLIAYYRFDQDETTDLILPDRSTGNFNGMWMDSGGGVTTPTWITTDTPIGIPEIAVYSGTDNTAPELFNNQLIPVNYGDVITGTRELTFTIENTGFLDLNVTDISVGGDFTVTSATSFLISAGSSVNFTVELNASSAGISNEFVTITSDDADETTFSFPVTGVRGLFSNKVWWSDDTPNLEDDISRSDLDGSNTQAPYYSGFSVDIRGIAVDQVNNMIFWTNTDAEIACGRMGDTGFTAEGGPIVDESGGSPKDFLGLDVDGVASKIYWADAENGQIRRVNFDGTGAEVLLTIAEPRDVALDVAGGKMYYVANPSFVPQVWRANLDGTSPEMLYSSGTTFFEGIALDLVNNHVYWTESVGGISRSDLDGSNQVFVSSQVTSPQGIDVDPENEMMYVVDGATIVRINYQDDPVEIIQSGASVQDPQFLALDIRTQLLGGVVISDYLALEALYNATDGANWTDNTDWLTSNPVSGWNGVTTAGNRVTELRLNNNNLEGTIPTELQDLDAMTYLSFQDNVLSGSIPTFWNNLVSLTHLSLDGNQFTGSIPTELGLLINLDFLDLDRNMLTGTVPVELTNLINLTQLRFDENQLTGTLDPDFGNLTALTHFEFNDNMFTGVIPATYANLVNLQFFNIRNNSFEDLPDMSGITSLVAHRVNGNAFQFDDLELNISTGGFDYISQANVTAPANENLDEGDALNVIVAVGGSANQYQWYKDGSPVIGQTTDNLLIESVAISDAGAYHLEVTNTIVTGLTISSDPFTVTVTPTFPEINVFVGTDNSGTAVTDDQATRVDLGTALLTNDIVQSFAIENTGTAVLMINSIISSDPEYAVSNIPATVGIGATETFSITLDGANAGTFATTITIDNNDTDEDPFTFPVTGEITGSNQPPDLSYIFYLDENSPVGTMLGAVVATDLEGDPLTYSILSGNTNNAFAIGSTTGVITVNDESAIDFETTPVFSLIVQADDGNGGVSMVDITINLNDIIDENPLGLSDLDELVTIYPNPASGRLFVELQGVLFDDLEVKLFTVSGSQVLTNSRILSRSNELIEIDLEDLTQGIYLLKISNDDEVITKNILVK